MMWGEIAKCYAAVFQESMGTSNCSKRSVI
jgi:hypothetical protein